MATVNNSEWLNKFRKLSELRNKKVVIAAAGLLLLLIGLWSITGSGSSSGRAMDGEVPTFEVRQGPLTISVNVAGTIKAREQEVIKCEVEGQTTILSIVPEGEQVKEGDLLIELDASELQDAKVDQEIRVQNAEAAFIGAREALAVTRNQTESDVDKAQLALQFAEEDLKNFIDGEFPKQLKEAETRITLAKGAAARAEEKLRGSERLAKQDFITSIELEADKNEALKTQLDLELAQQEKELLTDFTYKRELAQLESDVKQAGMALERTERKAAADIVQAEADLKAKESEYNRQKDKLDKLIQQIEKTTIYAPSNGLVVYATSARGSWRGNDEPLDEGQVVREREELIYLPTGASFMAEVDVHEASLTKIKEGLPVNISVDALPGRRYRGHVVTVAPLPDAQSVWLNPDLKVYNTDIVIEGDTEGLRTGMTCLAEIIVEVFDSAVYVPVQAVVRVHGKPTVYVARGRQVEPRQVQIGLDNNSMVHITGGLEPGERVLLSPPLATSGDAEEQTAEGEEEGTDPDATATDDGGPPSPSQSSGEEDAGAGQEKRDDGESARQDSPQDSENSSQGDSQIEALREQFRNASPEEREQMRKQMEERLKDMSPEQREQLMQRFRGRGGSGGGPGAGGGPGRGRERD